MKKLIAFILMLSLMLGAAALAEDLGVQVIGGPNVTTEPLSLEDMKLGETYYIDGYAIVSPKEFAFYDFFPQYDKDAQYMAYKDWSGNNKNVVYWDSVTSNSGKYYTQASWKESGLNAEFAWFLLDLTNLQKSSYAFMKNATVKVVYQDEYEFAGWIRQVNYDYIFNPAETTRYAAETKYAHLVVLDPTNEEAQEMLYTGTYVFGCTLPNAVIADEKSPLRIEITLEENELTYHIRK